MEQIDVMKYEEELKKGRLKRMFQKRQTLTTTLIGAVNATNAIISDTDFFRAFSIIIAGIELIELKKYWKQEGKAEEAQLFEMLRGTTTYKELEEEYNNYVKDVAKLIRNVGLTSAKETVLYLQGLMESGCFAKNRKHQYKNYQYEADYLIELSGAKVVTGTCVCRHMSSFFVDVMNELGYIAANVTVTEDHDDPVKRIQKRNVILNHAVAAIVDNGQKFLFDPTHGVFAALPQDFDFSEIESILVSQYVIPDKKQYLIMSPELRLLNFGREEQCKKVNTTKLATISIGEVKYLRDKIEKVLKGNHYNQMQFLLSHERQRQRIESLYQELMPYSENPIERHIVRK